MKNPTYFQALVDPNIFLFTGKLRTILLNKKQISYNATLSYHMQVIFFLTIYDDRKRLLKKKKLYGEFRRELNDS